MSSIKFQDMPYHRLEEQELRARVEQILERLRNATDYPAARAAFMEMQQIISNFSTLSGIANIRSSINTADPFYAAEREYWDQLEPAFQEMRQMVALAMLKHPLRSEFEKELGTLYFSDTELALKSFSPVIAPLMQEESRLIVAYDNILASAQIPFDGKILTLPQLTPYKQSADPMVRKAAWCAEGEYFMSHAQELDDIYDQLVRLRTEMGRKMGHENFIPLGYYRMNRNSYDKSDVEKFRKAVLEYIVPIASSLKQDQAKRLGAKYPMLFSDDSITFRSGNPIPQGSSQDILDTAKKMYHQLSPETAEFIDVLYDGGLLDVLSKKGKAGGGYCTSLPDHRVPFVFANFNGTAGDVEVMTHEAGHAFAAYMSRNIVPLEQQGPTLESCEVHSMSMEFFAEEWSDDFFGTDARKFKYSHLASALTFIPYGTIVDAFQHEAYGNPDMTAAERHQVWAKLESQYRPWLDLSEIPFYREGRGWQAKLHIYKAPFYYIDYCLAQTVALQFWALIQQDRQAAWDKYLSLVKMAGTKTFTGLLTSSGLKTPFDSECLRQIVGAAEKFLNSYSMDGIE